MMESLMCVRNTMMWMRDLTCTMWPSEVELIEWISLTFMNRLVYFPGPCEKTSLAWE